MGTSANVRRTVAALAGTLVLVGLLPGPDATPVAAAPTQEAPPPTLDEPVNGPAAVEALGDDLPAVAAEHDMTAAELEDELRTDETLWVDEGLALYYVDAEATDAAIETAAALETAASAPFPLEDTFTLHSNPLADRVIYLDFDGATTTGTDWNVSYGPSVPSTAFDLDGNPGTFSDTEREMVQSVWQRVAEDYAPFEVDITTEPPSAGDLERVDELDQSFGTTVVLAGTNPIQPSCECGGLAYVGVYDLIGPDHDSYQPAFVFQEGLGGNLTSAKLLAEAASHEAGHNLGLSHDGTGAAGYYTGHGSWAPIMGVAYDRPISQWSQGEYSGANNSEDDLAVITSFGLPAVGDDHGNANGAATSLGAIPSAAATGVIGTRTDVDVFSFEAPGGIVSIDVAPATASPNLDVSLSVYDGTGGLVGTADPASGTASVDEATGLAAELVVSPSPGTYYLQVDGAGAETPPTTGYSDYGSLGAYRITTSLGLCGIDDDLDDDDLSSTRLLIPGQSTTGTRCADDDWIRVPGHTGATLTAELEAIDDDLFLDILDAGGSQLDTVTVLGGTTDTLVHPFTTDGDHFLRVRSSGVESRYNLTTSMPVCGPDDQYEAAGDDWINVTTPLSVPGTRSGIGCSEATDTNGSDYMTLALVEGRELTVEVDYPANVGGLFVNLFFWPSSGSVEASATVSGDHQTLTYTPETSGNYQLRVLSLSGGAPYHLSVAQAVPPPSISNVSPSAAEVGDSVTITGTDLDTTSDVTFSDGAAALFTIDSPTQITATVPVGAVDGPIAVTTDGGQAASVSFDVVGASSPNVTHEPNSPTRVLDGDLNTWWQTLGGAGPRTIEIALPAAEQLSSVRTQFHSTGYRFTDYTIETWNGASWDLAATIAGNTAADITTPIAGVTTDRFRLTATTWATNNPAYGPAIREITWTNGPIGAGSPNVTHEPNSPTRVLDGDLNTWWQTLGGAGPRTIEIALPAAEQLSSVRTQFHSTGYRFTDYTIETWNGASWDLAATIAGNTAADITTPIAGVTTDRFRLTATTWATNNPAYGPAIREITWTNGPIGAGSPNVTHEPNSPTRVLDGDLNTWWQTLGGAGPRTIEIALPAAEQLSSVRTQFHSTGYRFTDYTIETWNGASWDLAATIAGNTAADITTPIAGVTTDRFRLTATTWATNNPAYGPAIREITWTNGPIGAGSPNVTHEPNSPTRVLDGDLNTWWQTLGGAGPRTIEIALPAAEQLSSVRTQFHSTGYRFTDYTIETWNGASWDLAATIAGNTAADITTPIAGVTTDRFRLTATTWATNNPAYGPAIREITWTNGPIGEA